MLEDQSALPFLLETRPDDGYTTNTRTFTYSRRRLSFTPTTTRRSGDLLGGLEDTINLTAVLHSLDPVPQRGGGHYGRVNEAELIPKSPGRG